jgi:YjbE family integral membrane protein
VARLKYTLYDERDAAVRLRWSLWLEKLERNVLMDVIVPAGFESLAVALFNIVMLDIVLSGDNAVVIGMAVYALPPRQAKAAIVAGGTLAVVLRIVLTALASVLLVVPLLQLAGAAALAWITYRLLSEDKAGERAGEGSNTRFRDAIRTIVVADITMSLDNVLAVGAAAHGNTLLLVGGLILSMALLLAGGALVASVIGRAPWLKYVGAAVLLVLAGEMAVSDRWVRGYFSAAHSPAVQWICSLALACVIGWLVWRKRRAAGAWQAGRSVAE